MKPLLFQNIIPEHTSFAVQEDILPRFYGFLHYHPEYQLTLIINGSGSLVAGDSVTAFRSGSVFLLGANQPHVFRDDNDSNVSQVHALSVYFRADAFGKEFFRLPENHAILELLQQAARGISMQAGLREKTATCIAAIRNKKGFEALHELLGLLYTIAVSDQRVLLSSAGYSHPGEHEDKRRLQAVLELVMKNYHRDIPLDEAATASSMSVTSFCRYFKQHTRKTFTQFLNEVRIGHACNDLIYSGYNINEIAYRSGFNNISHFNRLFKQVTGTTPSAYLKKTKKAG